MTQHRRQRQQALSLKTSEAYHLYLNSLATSGRRSMQSLLKQFAKRMHWQGELHSMPWIELRYANLFMQQSNMRQCGLSANTINTTMAAVKGVLRAACLLEVYPWQEYERIQTMSRVKASAKRQGRAITHEELEQLLQCAQHSDDMLGRRDATLMALLAYTGMRRSEIAKLTHQDINWHHQHIIVQSGKGDKKRIIPMPLQIAPLLKAWTALPFTQQTTLWTLPGHQEFNAQSIYHMIRKRVKQAGLAALTPHDFRRSFVTQLLAQGVDINITRQLAGHQNVQTTLLYDKRSLEPQQAAMANFSYAMKKTQMLAS